MFKSLSQEFDPIDREILERAFNVAWATVKQTDRLVTGFDNEYKITAVLRSNLIEIAQTKRFSDAEALLDVLLDRLNAGQAVARFCDDATASLVSTFTSRG